MENTAVERCTASSCFSRRGAMICASGTSRIAEPRRAAIAQKRGRQHERRVGGGHAIERSIERRHQERLPESAALSAPWPFALQPLLRSSHPRPPSPGCSCSASSARAMCSFSGQRKGVVATQTMRAGETAREGSPRAAAARGRSREKTRDVEAILQVQRIFHARRAARTDELRAAGQETRAARCRPRSPSISNDVARPPSSRLRSKSSTRAPASLRSERRRRARKPAADDRYARASHERTPRAVSRLWKAPRARAAEARGSRSIFFSRLLVDAGHRLHARGRRGAECSAAPRTRVAN